MNEIQLYRKDLYQVPKAAAPAATSAQEHRQRARADARPGCAGDVHNRQESGAAAAGREQEEVLPHRSGRRHGHHHLFPHQKGRGVRATQSDARTFARVLVVETDAAGQQGGAGGASKCACLRAGCERVQDLDSRLGDTLFVSPAPRCECVARFLTCVRVRVHVCVCVGAGRGRVYDKQPRLPGGATHDRRSCR